MEIIANGLQVVCQLMYWIGFLCRSFLCSLASIRYTVYETCSLVNCIECNKQWQSKEKMIVLVVIIFEFCLQIPFFSTIVHFVINSSTPC